ncbi:hypothetical protein Landi51_13467 [Colletotrichum acutatum]
MAPYLPSRQPASNKRDSVLRKVPLGDTAKYTATPGTIGPSGWETRCLDTLRDEAPALDDARCPAVKATYGCQPQTEQAARQLRPFDARGPPIARRSPPVCPISPHELHTTEKLDPPKASSSI